MNEGRMYELVTRFNKLSDKAVEHKECLSHIRKEQQLIVTRSRLLTLLTLLLLIPNLAYHMFYRFYLVVEELVALVLALIHPYLAHKWLGSDSSNAPSNAPSNEGQERE